MYQSIILLLTASLSAVPLTSCCAQTGAKVSAAAPSSTALVDAGAPFGKLRLVDEIVCGAAVDAAHEFSEMPAGVSKIETILGAPARVLPNTGEAKYFAYRIGKNKNLKAGAAYVLAVEFPEDKARSLFIVNRGAEMVRG
ncbi:MAG: hypothetical protein H8F28_08545, partial [Fibrella sp.]|nr:hypothetical protein [Armatimonadota bacterium]